MQGFFYKVMLSNRIYRSGTQVVCNFIKIIARIPRV